MRRSNTASSSLRGVQNKRTLTSLFSPRKAKQWKQAATLNGRSYVVGHVPRGTNSREAEFEGPLRGNTSSTKVCSFNFGDFGWDLSMTRGLRVLQLGGYWNNFAPAVNVILHAAPQALVAEHVWRRPRDVCDVRARTASRQTLPVAGDRAIVAQQHDTPLRGHRAHANDLRQIASPALEKVMPCYTDVTSWLNHLKQQSLTSLPLQHLRIEASLVSTSSSWSCSLLRRPHSRRWNL